MLTAVLDALMLLLGHAPAIVEDVQAAVQSVASNDPTGTKIATVTQNVNNLVSALGTVAAQTSAAVAQPANGATAG